MDNFVEDNNNRVPPASPMLTNAPPSHPYRLGRVYGTPEPGGLSTFWSNNPVIARLDAVAEEETNKLLGTVATDAEVAKNLEDLLGTLEAGELVVRKLETAGQRLENNVAQCMEQVADLKRRQDEQEERELRRERDIYELKVTSAQQTAVLGEIIHRLQNVENGHQSLALEHTKLLALPAPPSSSASPGSPSVRRPMNNGGSSSSSGTRHANEVISTKEFNADTPNTQFYPLRLPSGKTIHLIHQPSQRASELCGLLYLMYMTGCIHVVVTPTVEKATMTKGVSGQGPNYSQRTGRIVMDEDVHLAKVTPGNAAAYSYGIDAIQAAKNLCIEPRTREPTEKTRSDVCNRVVGVEPKFRNAQIQTIPGGSLSDDWDDNGPIIKGEMHSCFRAMAAALELPLLIPKEMTPGTTLSVPDGMSAGDVMNFMTDSLREQNNGCYPNICTTSTTPSYKAIQRHIDTVNSGKPRPQSVLGKRGRGAAAAAAQPPPSSESLATDKVSAFAVITPQSLNKLWDMMYVGSSKNNFTTPRAGELAGMLEAMGLDVYVQFLTKVWSVVWRVEWPTLPNKEKIPATGHAFYVPMDQFLAAVTAGGQWTAKFNAEPKVAAFHPLVNAWVRYGADENGHSLAHERPMPNGLLYDLLFSQPGNMESVDAYVNAHNGARPFAYFVDLARNNGSPGPHTFNRERVLAEARNHQQQRLAELIRSVEQQEHQQYQQQLTQAVLAADPGYQAEELDEFIAEAEGEPLAKRRRLN